MFDPSFLLSIKYVLHIEDADEHSQQSAGPF